MSLFDDEAVVKRRVQALGAPFLEGFVRNVDRGITPTRPSRPRPAKALRRPPESSKRIWPYRIRLGAVLLMLSVAICLVTYHLSPSHSFQPRALSTEAFHSRDLVIAKSCTDTVSGSFVELLDTDTWRALENIETSPLHIYEELVRSLLSLTGELSQAILIASTLSSHIAVDSSYLIKMAANTERCSNFADIRPSISTARDYVNQLLSSLHASGDLFTFTLNIVAAAHRDAQLVLASALRKANTLWERLVASTSSTRAEEKLQRYKQMERWSSMLTNATRDLKVGKAAVISEFERYAQLDKDLDVLEQKAVEALRTVQTEDARCTISGLRMFERSFLDVVFKAAKNETNAQKFYDHYQALKDGSNIFQRILDSLEESGLLKLVDIVVRNY